MATRLKMTKEEEGFCVELVNMGVFSNVFEDWAEVKKHSHNQYGGWVTVWLTEDEEKNLIKIDPKTVFAKLHEIIEEVTDISEETEKNLFYAVKRCDIAQVDVENAMEFFKLLCGYLE